MTTSHATRALRAAVFTALAVPLSASGQVVVTGRPLPPALVAGATVVVFLVAAALAGAERRLLHISAVLVPVELLLNTTFNLGQTTCAPAFGAGHGPVHGMNLLVCGGGSMDSSFLPGPVAPAAAQVFLLLVHLLVAVVAALWLRLGDSALSGLAGALRALGESLGGPLRRLLLLAPVPASPVRLVPPPVADRPRPRRTDVLCGPAPRRGPPVLALAA
ncbi:hypothetical protein GCM10018781_19740 [Kitasatospora indigofera]|uniref:Integral membrane protein n=1 Tax=Kitasatospora indigofera TaxID=67307 RepID=A0A919FJX4_9ACTN|nr:hypothetical protein [Kitasatospora indigofera]GHH66216.1 hypothetical protein GCM10018781_19740 [Kitasatospora indigofera]